MKKFIKSLIPPILFSLLNQYKNRKHGWFGNYQSWDEAKNASTGYDSEEILQKVKTSLLKVKHGKAVYERDSVIFDKIQYSWPLLAGVMLASSKIEDGLRVLDFGGSLGSTYFQNKKFLDELKDVSWNVVEQKYFVDVGKKEFQDERLKFYYDVNSCVKVEKPNVLVLSSVLQYIEKPYALLNEILKYDFKYILFDRTPFDFKNQDRIKLQVVPPLIYKASYPCWFFDKTKFLQYFENTYKLVEEFDAIDGMSGDYQFCGFIMEKK